MNDQNDPNWLSKQLQLLMSAYAYNLYSDANRSRADDLLVRQRVSDALGRAVTALTRLSADYSARFIPPSTRENPFPPADRMAGLKGLQQLREEVGRLSSLVLGLAVPTQDRVWAKYHSETELLHALLRSDFMLISQADALLEAVEALTPEDWNSASPGAVHEKMGALENSLKERERFLSLNP